MEIGKKRLGFVILIASLVLGSGAIWKRWGESQGEGQLKRRRPAPDFTIKDAQSKTFHLSSQQGKAVMLHFWASWCPPCLEEIPGFVKLATDFKDKPIAFVAVSIDESWEDAEKILSSKALPLNLVSLLDLSKKLPEEYGTYQYPETYLLDRNLHIVTKWVGPQDWGGSVIHEVIEKIASGL